MRTTVTLDRDVERILRETAVRTHKPFKKVLNDTLRAGIEQSSGIGRSEAFVLKARPMGLRAGHDPAGFNRLAEASVHVRSWLGLKQVRLHDILPDDVATALELLESAGTAGNLTTAAQIAAVALRLDAEVHTADLDFGRFAGVRFRNPLV